MERSFGLLSCGWGVLFALLGSEAFAAACTAPAYEAGKVYVEADRVQNIGRQFECWKDDEAPLGIGSWQWCRQTDYNPGLPAGSGAIHWPDAWKDLGECGGFQGNRLTLNFTTLSGRAPLANPVPGVSRADQVVTGVLRCKAEEIPISASRAKQSISIT